MKFMDQTIQYSPDINFSTDLTQLQSKIHAGLILTIEKLILKYIWKSKGTDIHNNFEKVEQF